MSRWSGWLDALSALLRREREERELEEELRFHLERAVEENVRAGMAANEARRAAVLTSAAASE